MDLEITFDGESFRMQDIKEMKLEQVEGSEPPEFQIVVVLTNGTSRLYPMTLENVASMNAWLAHVYTFAPAHSRKLKGPGK